jgi:carboxylesterase type B
MGTSSDEGMPGRFPEIVRANIPLASDEDIAKLQSLYPYPAGLPEKLAWDFTTDIVFACPASNIAQAYSGKTREYIYSIPPAMHGYDLICR